MLLEGSVERHRARFPSFPSPDQQGGHPLAEEYVPALQVCHLADPESGRKRQVHDQAVPDGCLVPGRSFPFGSILGGLQELLRFFR